MMAIPPPTRDRINVSASKSLNRFSIVCDRFLIVFDRFSIICTASCADGAESFFSAGAGFFQTGDAATAGCLASLGLACTFPAPGAVPADAGLVEDSFD